VAGTLDVAKRGFKGGPVNETEGKKVSARIIQDDRLGELAISRETAGLLSAGEGDLVHLSDVRRWLGGLRSTQARISAIHHRGSDVVVVSPDLIKRGNLIIKRRHRLEKIL